MNGGDTFISLLVLFTIFYLAYTGIKKQSLRDTYEEVKELFTPKE